MAPEEGSCEWESEYQEFLSTQEKKDFPVIDDGAAVDLNAPFRFFPGTVYAKLEKTGSLNKKCTILVFTSNGEPIHREYVRDTFVLPTDEKAVDELISGFEGYQIYHMRGSSIRQTSVLPNISNMTAYLNGIGCRNVISYL